MIEKFRTNRRIRRLQKDKRKIDLEYGQTIKDARQSKDHDLEQKLIGERFFERDLVEDEIMKIVSHDLREKAERLMIPIPEFHKNSPDWERSRIDDRYQLSPQALAKLRSEIRREKKERHEYMLMWLAALIGIIGALTGLFAVAGWSL